MDRDQEYYQYFLQRLRNWNSPILSENIEFFSRIINSKRPILGTELDEKVKELISREIDHIYKYDQTSAELIKLRFIENKTVVYTAQKLFFSIDQCNRIQQKTIMRIAKKIRRNINKIQEPRSQYYYNFPSVPLESILFGVDRHIKMLRNKLKSKSCPQVIAIVGIGGIGKTALAGRIFHLEREERIFDKSIWLQGEIVFSEPPGNSYGKYLVELCKHVAIGLGIKIDTDSDPILAVSELAKNARILIVIDNLENDIISASFWRLVRGISKNITWVVTSRNLPPVDVNVFSLSMRELNTIDSINLINHSSKKLNFDNGNNIKEEYLEGIYSIIGGNPLANKLFVGLLAIFPIEDIMRGIKHLNPGSIEDMFTHIYWQAWKGLTDAQKNVFLTMPLIAEEIGGTIGLLTSISGESREITISSIEKLHQRSLIEWRGNLTEKRYGIHHLTKTFLQSNINAWNPE